MTHADARWSPDASYLAIETSGAVGSVAVAHGQASARVFLPKAGEQASAVVPAIRSVLAEVRLERDALAGVVVGAGPGSFTGVRIAAATAKGLAHALGLPLWAFSSLAAGALSDRALPVGSGPAGWWGDPPGDAAGAPTRWVLFDARGERVYAACYLVTGGSLETLVPGHPTTVGELLERAPSSAAFTGDGAHRHRQRFHAAGRVVLGPPAGVPTADALLRLLALDPRVRPVPDLGRWEPEYLRASSAERERPRSSAPVGAAPPTPTRRSRKPFDVPGGTG